MPVDHALAGRATARRGVREAVRGAWEDEAGRRPDALGLLEAVCHKVHKEATAHKVSLDGTAAAAAATAADGPGGDNMVA